MGSRIDSTYTNPAALGQTLVVLDGGGTTARVYLETAVGSDLETDVLGATGASVVGGRRYKRAAEPHEARNASIVEMPASSVTFV